MTGKLPAHAFIPGEMASMEKPVRFKVADPDKWIQLCIQRDQMSLRGASVAEWRKMANEFAKVGAPACSDYCLRMAQYKSTIERSRQRC